MNHQCPFCDSKLLLLSSNGNSLTYAMHYACIPAFGFVNSYYCNVCWGRPCFYFDTNNLKYIFFYFPSNIKNYTIVYDPILSQISIFFKNELLFNSIIILSLITIKNLFNRILEQKIFL